VDSLKNALLGAFSGPKEESAPSQARESKGAPSVKLGADLKTPLRPDNLAELRRVGVPETSIDHFAGPAAAPVNAFSPEELNEDGTPRLGTLVNDLRPGLNTTSHRYVTVNQLDAPNRELAERGFYGFNAPTHDALNGRLNPTTQSEGQVDPTAPLPLDGQGFDLPGLGPIDPNFLGGHVSTERGRTPEGAPWAINSTTPGKHPLRGHITRSLIEHEGKFYVRTEGVGTGPTFTSPLLEKPEDDSLVLRSIFTRPTATNFWMGGGRDALNSIVGPPSFHNLDFRLNEWLQSQ
jgi:hypothetical protein